MKDITNINPFFDDKVRSRELAGFTLAETLYPSGLTMPRHTHEQARFGLVLQGGYSERYGQRVRTCAPAMLVFHPPDEDHAVQFQNCESRIFDVQFKAGWLEHIRQHTTALDTSCELSKGQATQLAAKLYREFREDDASALTLEGLVLEILGIVTRRTSTSERRPPHWLERAREILHAHYAENPAASSVATEVDAHPVHLAREFRRHYRCTMGEYMRRLRVERACRMLEDSALPLSQIASALGFYDQSHFSRVFKRQTGLPPAAYRANFRQR